MTLARGPGAEWALGLKLKGNQLDFEKIVSYFTFLLSGSPGIQTMPLQAAWHGCHKMQLKSVSMETGWLPCPFCLFPFLLLCWPGWV